MYTNSKQSMIIIVIAMLISLVLTPFTPAHAEETGRQIIFSVKGDSFTFLKIVGDNQNGILTTKSYGNGDSPMNVMITTGYWWKGTMVFTFKTVKNGMQQCVIDYLQQPTGKDSVMVTFSESMGCSGEGGSSVGVHKREVEVLYQVLFSEEDSLQVVKLADEVISPFECVEEIAKGVASASITSKVYKTIKVTTTCGGIGIGLLNDVLKKFNAKTEYYISPSAYLGFSGKNLYTTNPSIFGEDVKMVQQRLLELGYNEVGSVDGYFGPMTEKAIQHFQSDKQLTVTGVVDSYTWEKLFIGRLRSSAPQLASPQETNKLICDTCNFIALEERAKEIYNNIDFGNDYRYTIQLSRNEPLVWMGGWCAKNQTILDENLKSLSFQFWINGKPIPKTNFSISRTGDLYQDISCETYRIAFLSWSKGTTVIEYRWTVNANISDGTSSFSKGSTLYTNYIVTNP